MYNNFVILVIDLDNTLYQPSRGVLEAIDQRMSAYLIKKLGFTIENVDETRAGYRMTHGTTMKGLKANFGIDESDFLRYVHDLPIDNLLKMDVELRHLLAETKHPKFIFTNADYEHATSVLESLGLRDSFEHIFDVTALNYNGKPYPDSYASVERRIRALLDGDCRNIESSSFVFFDDYLKNLKGAKTHGWTTVLVDEEASIDHSATHVQIGGIEPYVDYTIRTIHSFPYVVELIESAHKPIADAENLQ